MAHEKRAKHREATPEIESPHQIHWKLLMQLLRFKERERQLLPKFPSVLRVVGGLCLKGDLPSCLGTAFAGGRFWGRLVAWIDPQPCSRDAASNDWLPVPFLGPGPQDEKRPSRPGSDDTEKIGVSSEPSSRECSANVSSASACGKIGSTDIHTCNQSITPYSLARVNQSTKHYTFTCVGPGSNRPGS